MSRPQPGESVEERILNAAAADLRRVGARRLTVVAVAAAAGMAHSNVYRFFPGKAGLLDALLARWLRPLETRLAEIVDGPDPADDKLERLLTQASRAYLDLRQDDPSMFALLCAAEPAALEPGRHRERLQAQVARVIEEGAATRVFPRADARRSLPLVLDLAHRFIDPAALAALGGAPATIAPRRDRALRVLLRALTRGDG